MNTLFDTPECQCGNAFCRKCNPPTKQTGPMLSRKQLLEGEILRLALRARYRGVTINECVRYLFGSALEIKSVMQSLERENRISKINSEREGQAVYVLPDNEYGRATV